MNPHFGEIRAKIFYPCPTGNGIQKLPGSRMWYTCSITASKTLSFRHLCRCLFYTGNAEDWLVLKLSVIDYSFCGDPGEMHMYSVLAHLEPSRITTTLNDDRTTASKRAGSAIVRADGSARAGARLNTNGAPNPQMGGIRRTTTSGKPAPFLVWSRPT